MSESPAAMSDPESRPDRRRRRWPLVIAGVVLLIAAGVAVAAVAGLGPFRGATGDLDGTVAVPRDPAGGEDDCRGADEWSDVTAGTEVTVRDPAGDVLATAELERVGEFQAPGVCLFRFLLDAPAGPGPYRFSVGGHHGPQEFTAAELDNAVADPDKRIRLVGEFGELAVVIDSNALYPGEGNAG